MDGLLRPHKAHNLFFPVRSPLFCRHTLHKNKNRRRNTKVRGAIPCSPLLHSKNVSASGTDSERSHTAHYTNVCRKTYTNETGTDSREAPAPLTNTTLTYINPLPRGAKVPEEQKISKNWRPQKRERGKQIPKKRDWALSRDATFWYFFCDFSGRSPDSTHASYPLTLHSASVPSVPLCFFPPANTDIPSRPCLA